MDNPIRWKQRFVNLEKAYKLFVKLVDIEKPSEIENMALIQAFEFTYELTWNTMKDYLEEEGLKVTTPKAVFRQAFQSELISDGEVWMAAIKQRNNTSHNYIPEVMEETVRFIREEFSPRLRDFYRDMRKELGK